MPYNQYERELLVGVASCTAGVVNSAAVEDSAKLWAAVEELRTIITETCAISREILGKTP